MTRWRRALEPKPRPLDEYLEGSAFVGGFVQLLVAVLIGALATSRVDAHVLSPWTLAGLVAAAAAGGVLIGWPVGLFGGAADTLKGLVVVSGSSSDSAPTVDDELAPRRLWSVTVAWAAAAGAWSLAAAALVAVVLDGRHANALLVILSLAALAGVSGRAVDLVARRKGIDIARAHLARSYAVGDAAAVPVRRRAWRQIALPVAVGQGAINAGFAWLLFHDFVQGDEFAPRALTEEAVVAEVATIVVLLVAVFAPMIRSWGEVDAALGRVTLDEQPTATIGPQAFVYIVVAAFVLGPLAGLLLPTAPTLMRVIVVRSLLAAVVVLVIAGLAYVRGAVNGAVAVADRTMSSASPLQEVRA